MSQRTRSAITAPKNPPAVTRGASGARASATPDRAQAVTASRSKPAPTQEELFEDARSVVPDLKTALAFLQQGKYQLVPPDEGAFTKDALVTGLLHFAQLAPAAQFARQGLAAFAFLAQEVYNEQLCNRITNHVVDRVEEQFVMRLDEYLDAKQEAQMEHPQAYEGLEGTRRELDKATEKLGEACARLGEAEATLTAARAAMEAAGQATPPAGTSPTASPTLTLETAPARTRRAVDLADLMQRQLLIRGVALKDTAGQTLGDRQALEKARQALEMLPASGLSPPKDAAIDAAKIQKHGDVVFTLSNVATARWLLQPNIARAFAAKMGMEAKVIERTYKLIAERVPVEFDPHNPATLRAVEEAHGLDENAIARADWIKPVERRRPGQRLAFLQLTVTSINQANKAIKGLTLGGRRVLVRKDYDEPKRCMRCQEYDHLAKDCKSLTDICANCAGTHPTASCTVRDNPTSHRCANCDGEAHPAWDRACPTFLARTRALATRRADSGFRFYVTNNPETWVTEEEELVRAPPMPSLWSQIQHRLDPTASAPAAPRQTRLNAYYRQNTQPSDPPINA